MNGSTIRYANLGQVQLRYEEVDIYPGPAVHRLDIRTSVTADWLDANVPSRSTASLLVTGNLWLDAGGVGWVAPLSTQVLTLRDFPAPEHLTFSVSDEQLVAIERARGEGEVRLRLNLQSTLLTPPANIFPVLDEQASVTIPVARWQQLLDQAQVEVGILVRVRSPLTDPALGKIDPDGETEGSLSQAAFRLRKARAQLRDHQWEGCVETCRKVLENVARLHPNMPSAKAVASVNAQERTQEQRWASVHHSLMSLTAAAHHDDEVTIPFSWGRPEAEAVLAATAGLLSMYVTKNA